MRKLCAAALTAAALLIVGGCAKKEEPAPEAAPKAAAPAGQVEASAAHDTKAMPPGHEMGGKTPPQRQIVVPDEVKKGWKAVVVEVTDREKNTTEDVTIGIGQTAKVGDLEITVEAFLPSFSMGGGVITSKSNQTENPAARLVVKDKGVEVFAGWLFSMYPEAHPFQHERYALLLKDFVKAE